MTEFTQNIGLNRITSSASSEIIVDKTNKQPLKWFTIIVDQECYIDINNTATTNSIHLMPGESFTSPEKIRAVYITVIRATSANVTVRGSAMW